MYTMSDMMNLHNMTNPCEPFDFNKATLQMNSLNIMENCRNIAHGTMAYNNDTMSYNNNIMSDEERIRLAESLIAEATRKDKITYSKFSFKDLINIIFGKD